MRLARLPILSSSAIYQSSGSKQNKNLTELLPSQDLLPLMVMIQQADVFPYQFKSCPFVHFHLVLYPLGRMDCNSEYYRLENTNIPSRHMNRRAYLLAALCSGSAPMPYSCSSIARKPHPRSCPNLMGSPSIQNSQRGFVHLALTVYLIVYFLIWDKFFLCGGAALRRPRGFRTRAPPSAGPVPGHNL